MVHMFVLQDLYIKTINVTNDMPVYHTYGNDCAV